MERSQPRLKESKKTGWWWLKVYAPGEAPSSLWRGPFPQASSPFLPSSVPMKVKAFTNSKGNAKGEKHLNTI